MQARFKTRAAYTAENRTLAALDTHQDRACCMEKEPHAEIDEKYKVAEAIKRLRMEAQHLKEMKQIAEDEQGVLEKRCAYADVSDFHEFCAEMFSKKSQFTKQELEDEDTRTLTLTKLMINKLL